MSEKPHDQGPVFHAGFMELVHIHKNIEKIFQHEPKLTEEQIKENKSIMMDEPAISDALEAICSGQSLAYSCLFDNGRKRGTETKSMYRLRMERVSRIRDACKDINIVELGKRGVRNAIVHLDERLTQAIIEGRMETYLWNVSLSSTGGIKFPPRTSFIRVYFFKEDELIVFDEKLKLRPLLDEVKKVMAALRIKPSP